MSELLSLYRMARRVGVNPAWLKEQANLGKVPCLKADQKYLFNANAVIEALTVEAATAQGGGA